MRTYYSNSFKHLQFTGLLVLLFLVGAYNSAVYAQLIPPPPPRPIKVYASLAQGLNFGAFFPSVSGGTVTIPPVGLPSTTGGIIQATLSGYSFSPAIVEVEANVGTIITITNGIDAKLTGSNGGSIMLHVGACDKVSPFISDKIPPIRTQIIIGGTLTIESSSTIKYGRYTGNFEVIFNQQ